MVEWPLVLLGAVLWCGCLCTAIPPDQSAVVTGSRGSGTQVSSSTYNKEQPKEMIFIIVGASCGGAIILAAIVAGVVWCAYHCSKVRKRNKVRGEIIAHYKNVKNAEVCRYCWGRQAMVYCEDCPQHYFCELCSDSVHNVYRDKRCCTFCRKSLGKHRITNVTWPAQPLQPQGLPDETSADAPQSEAILIAQGGKGKIAYTPASYGSYHPSTEGTLSINNDRTEPLLTNSGSLPQTRSGMSTSSSGDTNESYTTFRTLLGYDEKDEDY